MEKNWADIKKVTPIYNDFDFSSAADPAKDIQNLIMRQSTHIPEDGRINIRFIKDYEWAANWAESLLLSFEDSTYQTNSGFLLPTQHESDEIRSLYELDDNLATTGLTPVLTMDERLKVSERLKHFKLSVIDNSLIEALSEACNWIILEAFTKENCLRELEMAENSVHRAELFMMMGNDVEAYREFKKISPEEFSNPENALTLVDLIERYENTKSALKVLKRWFLLEIVLHPIPFDLVYDLIPDKKILEPSPRVRYLKSLLLHSREMDLNDLNRQLFLVLPNKSTQKPELADVNNRLKKFGLSMDQLDLVLDESTPVNLFTMMTGLSEQLIHTADLARSLNDFKLAIKALERAVLANFIIINLPKPIYSDALEPISTDNQFTNRVILDSLSEIEEQMEELLFFSDLEIEYHLLRKQIECLRSYIERLGTSNIMENSNGMSSMP